MTHMSTPITAIIKLDRQDFFTLDRAKERGLTSPITSITCGDTFDIHVQTSNASEMANFIQYVIWNQHEMDFTDGTETHVVDSEGNQSECIWDVLGEEYSVENVQKKIVNEFLLKSKKFAVA